MIEGSKFKRVQSFLASQDTHLIRHHILRFEKHKLTQPSACLLVEIHASARGSCGVTGQPRLAWNGLQGTLLQQRRHREREREREKSENQSRSRHLPAQEILQTVSRAYFGPKGSTGFSPSARASAPDHCTADRRRRGPDVHAAPTTAAGSTRTNSSRAQGGGSMARSQGCAHNEHKSEKCGTAYYLNVRLWRLQTFMQNLSAPECP